MSFSVSDVFVYHVYPSAEAVRIIFTLAWPDLCGSTTNTRSLCEYDVIM